MGSEYVRLYRLEVEIQDNGIIRDPFGWIVGRCNDEWLNTVVRHELPERTCRNTQSDFDFMCSECGKCVDNGRVLGINYCSNCGAKVIGG